MLEIINILDESNNSNNNHEYSFSDMQAKAILDLRLHRLTGLEREEIKKDLKNIMTEVDNFLNLLNSEKILLKKMKEELISISNEFSTPRKTEIIEIHDESKSLYI